MKMRTIMVEPKFLIDALQGKTSCFATNLPCDVQLLDLRFDLCSNKVSAVIRSEGFEDVAELYPIPEFKIVYERTSRIVSEPMPNVKTEAKSVSAVKTQFQQEKTVQIKSSQSANRMEQEFSPEQRKLLSFKMEKERIVVKPTQFLKAEWEDINETVKSLGGRWVKGDIISYWEIPVQQT